MVCSTLTFPEKTAILTPMKEVKPMKNNRFLDMLYRLAYPIAVTVLGALLVISPDSASVLIARVLGWVLTVTGIGFGIAAILDRDHAVRKGISAVLFACTGGTLAANPLLLAAWIGRIIGLLIAARGIRDLVSDSLGRQLLRTQNLAELKYKQVSLSGTIDNICFYIF